MKNGSSSFSGERGGLLRRLLATDGSWTQAAARLALGGVMFPHGAQKLFGWFGGYGVQGTLGYLTGTIHLPYAVAVLVIAAESFGSLALLAGFGARLAAAGVAAVMVGAVLTVHLANGFFMDWGGTMSGEGFEYHILAVALALVVVRRGSGAGSVDRALTS